MNKKYINGILIAFLLFIWGGVIYRYFGKKEIVIPNSIVNNSGGLVVDYSIAKDTFILNLNRRDPFKASKYIAIKSGVAKTKTSISKGDRSSKTMVWPNIEYYGFVKSAPNKTRKAHIKINGRLHRKRERETIEEVKLVKAYSDSIIVMYNKEKKTVLRK